MKSVRARLFLILFITLGSITTLILTRYITSNKTTSLIQSTYLIMRMDIRLLNMRRAEKDFLNRQEVDNLVYYRNNYTAFTNDWNMVMPLLKANNIDSSLLLPLKKDVDNYNHIFNKITGLVLTMGLTKDEGIRKKLQNNYQQIKKLLSKKNDTRLLNMLDEIQIHQKDFIIRRNPEELAATGKLYKELIKELKKYPEAEKQIKQLHATSTEIANMLMKIGLKKNQGLLGQLRKNAHQTEQHLTDIHNILLPKLRKAESNARVTELVIQLSTAFIMLFIIMSLIGSLRFSFESFIEFFKDAKTKKILIPIHELPYSEFKVMANIANDMIAARFKAEDELKDLNEHLEERIQEATREIRDLNKEIVDTQSEVVFTMGAIGETRSKETGNHVKRVAAYSYILAINCGIPEKEARMLEQASPMHDIGKVGIPDSILKKPGKLTNEEFDIMKTHAELGYSMLKHSQRPLMKTAAIVAYEHHEKWNGQGYPRGLSGNDIHIYGRITALADVFDALGTDRVYKKAWSDEKIFALLKEERGQHFDPQVVDAFFNNIDEILAVRKKYKDINNHSTT